MTTLVRQINERLERDKAYSNSHNIMLNRYAGLLKQARDALIASEEDINLIANIFDIDGKARTIGVIAENTRNSLRRANCLSKIEQHFTTVETEDGEEYDECSLRWGESPDEYIERFKALIITIEADTKRKAIDAVTKLRKDDNWDVDSHTYNVAIKESAKAIEES